MITSAVLECLEKEVVYRAKKLSKCFDILSVNDLRQLCFNLTKGHDIQIRRAVFKISLFQTNNLEKKCKTWCSGNNKIFVK